MAGAPCGTLRATRARRNAVMHSKAVAASDRSGLKGSSVRPSRGTGYLPAKSHVNRRAEWYKMCVLEMAMRRRKCAYRPASNKFAFFLAASSSLPCHGSLPFLSHLSHFQGNPYFTIRFRQAARRAATVSPVTLQAGVFATGKQQFVSGCKRHDIAQM